jgi:hypothetical protein
MSITVTIDLTEARLLSDFAGPVTPAENKAIAAEEARLVQRHLRARDASHAHTYPDGGRRSHFWRKAAESVTFATDSEGLTVSVTHQGVRLRYAGAPKGIGPVNAGALAIPASAEAYGRLPREFPDLRIVVFKGKNKAALVQKPAEGEYLGKVMFWLVKRTKPIAPDPTVIPPANVMLGLAVMRLRNLRERKAGLNV